MTARAPRRLVARRATGVAERVSLLRGRGMAATLLGSLSSTARETHITAMLGYIVAMSPRDFLPRLGFTGDCLSVNLERKELDGRSDIRVETSEGVGIVEAKLPSSDPRVQASRYEARWRTLLTNYVAPAAVRAHGLRYVSWSALAEGLRSAAARRAQPLRFLAMDLHRHLELHAMIPKSESLEVYAREINDLPTLRLFMEGWVYGCWHEQTNTIARALYFAPHFGNKLAGAQPYVRPGISHLAKIETVDVATTWPEFQAVLRERRGTRWMRSQASLLGELKGFWTWKSGRARSFALLDEPQLAFAPPIRKNALQAGSGWLSKRSYSFADLFKAWGSSDK